MTNKTTDNGANTVIADADATDNRHVANAAAAAIVAAVIKNETALAGKAKDWGVAVLNAVYTDKGNLDTLIGESKLASGFATLGKTEAGAKAKGRMNVYFSNARLIAERWATFTDEQRAALLKGESSLHYVAGELRKLDAKAKADAAKAEAEANPDAVSSDATALTLKEMVTALSVAYSNASDQSRDDADDAIIAFIDIVNALSSKTEVEAETAIAA